MSRQPTEMSLSPKHLSQATGSSNNLNHLVNSSDSDDDAGDFFTSPPLYRINDAPFVILKPFEEPLNTLPIPTATPSLSNTIEDNGNSDEESDEEESDEDKPETNQNCTISYPTIITTISTTSTAPLNFLTWLHSPFNANFVRPLGVKKNNPIGSQVEALTDFKDQEVNEVVHKTLISSLPKATQDFLQGLGPQDSFALNNSINTLNRKRWTPLLMAILNGREDVAKVLLECPDIQVTHITPYGDENNSDRYKSMNALYLTCTVVNNELRFTQLRNIIPKLIARSPQTLQHRPAFTDFDVDVVGFCVTASDYEALDILLEQGADINAKNYSDRPYEIVPFLRNQTGLMIAALRGNLKMVEYLLKKGARIDARNAGNETINQILSKNEIVLDAHYSLRPSIEIPAEVINLLKKTETCQVVRMVCDDNLKFAQDCVERETDLTQCDLLNKTALDYALQNSKILSDQILNRIKMNIYRTIFSIRQRFMGLPGDLTINVMGYLIKTQYTTEAHGNTLIQRILECALTSQAIQKASIRVQNTVMNCVQANIRNKKLLSELFVSYPPSNRIKHEIQVNHSNMASRQEHYIREYYFDMQWEQWQRRYRAERPLAVAGGCGPGTVELYRRRS